MLREFCEINKIVHLTPEGFADPKSEAWLKYTFYSGVFTLYQVWIYIMRNDPSGEHLAKFTANVRADLNAYFVQAGPTY